MTSSRALFICYCYQEYMLHHLAEFGASLWDSIYAWVGLISTILWAVTFVPVVRTLPIINGHPLILRYAPPLVAASGFIVASFLAYHQKSLEAEEIHRRYDELQNSAEGMFAIQGVKATLRNNKLVMQITIKNASSIFALRHEPKFALTEVDGGGTVPSPITLENPPLTPLETRDINFFPGMDVPEGNRNFVVKLHYSYLYGRLGTDKNFPYCEIDHCQFTFNPPNSFSAPHCLMELCK